MTDYSREPAAESFGASVSQAGRNWLEIAWRRKGLVGLATAAALLLGLLYFVQLKPVYQSKAQVLVVKKNPYDLSAVQNRQLLIDDYAATHKTLLESPLIVKRAIERRQLGELETLREKEDLSEAIIKAMTVTRNKGAGLSSNNVLDLAFRGNRPEDSTTVLNAVIESYQGFLDETYKDSSEDTVKLIMHERDQLQQELLKKEKEHEKFRKESPLLIWHDKEGGNLPHERLRSLEAKRGALTARKAEIQGHLQAIDTGLKSGSREALLAMLAEITGKTEGDPNRQNVQLSLQSQLYPLLKEEQRLLEMRGENHPEVQTIRKQIAKTRAFLGDPTASFQQGGGEGKDPVETYRDFFRQQLNHVVAQEENLTRVLEEEHRKAQALTAYEIEDQSYRNDLARKQEMFKGIIKKLQEVSLVKSVGGYEAKVIAAPTLGRRVYLDLLVFPLAGVVGLLGGFGLAYLAEVSDKGFRSIDEVRRRLRVQVVGQIPYLKTSEEVAGEAPALAPVLCCYHRPRSPEAESYRGVRTALYFSTAGEKHKIIQVTSPSAGDGKSTLAANLAVSIAQSGKRALLVDADLRKPTIHKLFNLSSEVGLGTIMLGESHWKEAVLSTPVAKLSVIPCGPLPPNPAELLTSPRFEELLEQLREEYDFVIVDTPPVLLVTDPSVVAPRVDGVLLNIRMGKHARPLAERAKEILDNLGANVLGVVVNDPDSQTGQFAYGYGYGYGEYHQENGNGTLPKPVEALVGTRDSLPGDIARIVDNRG